MSEERITSRENAGVKLFRQLSGSHKKRRESGLFAAEGLRLCEEAVRCGISVRRLFVTAEAQRRCADAVVRLGEACGGVCCISDELGAFMGDTPGTQGVFLIGEIPVQPAFLPRPDGRCLLLENLQDPGNLGTIIRCADAFGVDAVLLSASCPDLYAPKVLRASMGSVFRQKAYRFADLRDAVAQLDAAGVQTYAATLEKTSVPVQTLSGRTGFAAAVGNEGAGLTAALIKTCAGSVHIPMRGKTESLNAAAAAAILIWELFGRG